jgi:hypothetical protein
MLHSDVSSFLLSALCSLKFVFVVLIYFVYVQIDKRDYAGKD